MKKLSSLLLLTLSIRLLAGAALAAEIPDPDFYFNAGAGKETGKGDITYEYAFSKDPRKAAEAYVSLLTKEYGFALTDSYLETEVATWRLEDASGKMIRLDYDQGDGRTP